MPKMSWFDATGLASIAKSALKEAQRTIDKALDIHEDGTSSAPVNTPIDTNSDDFFGSWGLSSNDNFDSPKVKSSREIVTKSPIKSIKTTASLWGSFTGSFFEIPGEVKLPTYVESLDDSVDLGIEGFSRSKLVVQNSDESEHICLHTNEFQEEKHDSNISAEQDLLFDVRKDSAIEEISSQQPAMKSQEHTQSYINRLSVISGGSGKTSSESVEIISEGTGCTTSPDSEIQSVGKSISTSSSTGLKISESVEILPDSLTSPSSVEVLTNELDSSYNNSQNTDEFVSPLASPITEEKTSPESVEVILEEPDEDSVSYASISESTSVTLLEPPALSIKSQKISLKPDTLSEPITKGPSRSGMHLSLTQINSQLIDTQPLSIKENITNLVESSNIIDIPPESILHENQGDDEGSQSDITMIASDTVMESSSDTSITTENPTNSYYLKNMLADAMSEKLSEHTKICVHTDPKVTKILETISIPQIEISTREVSPESHSDLVKVGSDQTSGHTSGDENETTTSSDIEIISSPNGDSSSTQSRHSPAKLSGAKNKNDETSVGSLLEKLTFKKLKGHNRELSEASSISDDSHSSEIDRLVKCISEMTEILELREAKLIEMNRRNAEMQEINTDLQHQLNNVLTNQVESADLSQVTEEYTQRLSALEKKFQQAIRDKDILRKQLEQSKQESASRMTKSEFESMMSEKNEVINELREEGEKLSKQQLQHTTIIKKLRAKEKEHETTIKYLKENVEDLTSETDRLKRSLIAKEDIERSQIEAVHQLTSKNKKLEYEVSQLQSQLDDVMQKYETVKTSLDAAKKELNDKNKTNSELHMREQLLQSLENEKRMTESQNEEIISQLENLRYRLQQADCDYLRKEQNLRFENNELMKRLENAERRNEELAQSVMEVSKPLVRQLETLQSVHSVKLTTFEKVEQGLLSKINELQNKLQVASDSERTTREECLNTRSKVSSLETQLNSAIHQTEMLKIDMERARSEKIILEQELQRQLISLEQKFKAEMETNATLKREITTLEQQLSIEKKATDAEKQKTLTLQDQIRERTESVSTKTSPPVTRNTSPTLSTGHLSLAESLGSSIWSPEDHIDVTSTSRCTNILELQMLQTGLKQKGGEVHQLQWELSRREQEKNLLNSEIAKLIARVEELEQKSNEYDNLQTQFNEVQQQYDTLCQLYGEKVEEAEELKLDLYDVKELYKAQLDELLNQQKNS